MWYMTAVILKSIILKAIVLRIWSFCAPLSICPTGKKWQKTIICGEIFHNIYFPEEIDIFFILLLQWLRKIFDNNASKICFLINFTKANAQHSEDTHSSEQMKAWLTDQLSHRGLFRKYFQTEKLKCDRGGICWIKKF